MRRFFYDSYPDDPLSNYQKNDLFLITETIHNHWCRVLRAKISDQAILFDGFGGEYLVELIEIKKKSATVKLLKYIQKDRTPDFFSEIALVMSRGDRMDYAIQKATEMGVTSIQLLTSQNSEMHLKQSQVLKKMRHWQQIAISACEQCGMNRIPIIFSPIALDKWIQSLKNNSDTPKIDNYDICDFMSVVATDKFYQTIFNIPDLSMVLTVPDKNEASVPENLKLILKSEKKPFLRILIGAEGGLNQEEIAQAKAVHFKAWQIGNRIMRTETAPVVSLASMISIQSN